MNDKKIAFIIWVKEEQVYQECLSHLDELHIPEGLEIEKIGLLNVRNLAASYNLAMKTTSARYKVYLHQETLIIHKDFFFDLIKLFKNQPSLGMIGVCGSKSIPTNGVWWDSNHKCGKFYENQKDILKLKAFAEVQGEYEEVRALDGMLLATQYDVPWREDLFNTQLYSELAQALEINRAGYSVAVPQQADPWCINNGNLFVLGNEDGAGRNQFLDEYSKDLFPLVSILTPTHNRPDYLELALNTALNQTYRNTEIVISDNGDDEVSRQMLEPYLEKHSKIKYYRKKGMTIGENWQKCEELAKGEYRNFLLDDDLFHPDKIAKMMHYFLEYENIGLVTSYRQLINETGAYLAPIPATRKLFEQDTILNGNNLGNIVLKNQFNVIGEPTTVLFKAENISNYYLGREYTHISDVVNWLRMIANKRCVYIAEALSFFRLHQGQEQQRIQAEIDGECQWWHLIKDTYDNGLFLTNRLEYLETVSLRHNRAVALLTEKAQLIKSQNLSVDELCQCIDETRKELPPKHLPLVSIITVTYNSMRTLEACLKSVFADTRQPFEVIVVDNHSTDGTPSYLAGRNDITVIFNRENLGFSKATNQGLLAAQGEYCVLLNPDTQVSPDWLDRMLSHFSSDVGAVGPLSNCVAGLQRINLPTGPFLSQIDIKSMARQVAKINHGKAIETKLLIGFCMVLRKDLIEKLGGLDENLFLGNDDLDLSWRLRANGYRLKVAMDTFVYHEGQQSFQTVKKEITSRLVQESTDVLYAKLKTVYGENTVPTPMELWGMEWFTPTVAQFNLLSQFEDFKYRRPVATVYQVGLLSIVILTFNQLEYTKKCVKSLQRHTPQPHEIIFVDNGSTDNTVLWLKRLTKENKNYRVIENKNNLGFAKGSNQGIEVSRGEFILLLNNDVVVAESWFSGLLDCLNHTPAAGIVGPMTNNISGPQQVSSDEYRSVDDLDKYAAKFRKNYRHRRISLRRIVGFCMLFKRALVEQIGMLDESFGSGNFEDDDFCLRAALTGYKNQIAGDVFIHHYGSRSFIGNKIDYSSSMSGNIKIFDEKWTGLDLNTPLGRKVGALNFIDKAEALYQKGGLDRAIAMLIEGIRCAPEEKTLYYHLAEMLLDNKLYNDALEAINSMPPEVKDDVRYLEIFAYCTEGLDEEATKYADQILHKNIAYAPALNLKGVIAHKQGDDNAAEDYFLQAITSDPGYGEPYSNRGMLKWALDQKKEALDLLEKGFILSPTPTDSVTLYHSAITELEQFARAERLVRDAKTLHPGNKRILFFFIDILIKQGKLDMAMDEIEQAMLNIGIDDGMLAAALEIRNKVGAKKINKAAKNKGTISLCMIVKNEEQHLARCLLSAKPAVDEMIVVDTGSTDRTKEIAQVYGAKVFDFPWTNDFSAARNHSLSMAVGDWILVLDADEVISPLDYASLERIVKKKPAKPVAYTMVTRNYTNEVAAEGWKANDRRYGTEEAGTGWFPSLKVRLFVNNKQIRFQNPVHEFVEESLQKAGIEIKTFDMPVHHYGRFDKDKLMVKGKKYFLLGKQKIEAMNGDIKALKELAIQASELGEYEAGVALWKKVIELDRNNAAAFLNISYAYLKQEKYQEALVSSRRALELQPTMKEAALNYAGSELIAGDTRKAISVLETLLQKDPDYPPAIALIAAAYYMSGQKETGLTLFERLRKRGFNCTEFLNEQYRGVISQGKLDQAISLLEVAIKTGNINKDTRQQLAECQNKKDS